ncbi:MAG TPA: YihY/virulence factor BrkB family protein [Chitinophagaceae bacterium]|nr:YihY/virulence factor BrkB family protein [Chitinophagaceae bacterium]
MIKLARIILNLKPIKYFKEKSKKWILPGFHGVPLYEVMKFFGKQLRMSGLTERASAISFNFIMSIPPTCLFLFTIIPALPFVSKKSLKSEIHILLDDVLPSKIHDHALVNFINSFIDNTRIGLISFSFVLSLFFASNAMMGVMRSFDKNYHGFQKRKGLNKRWVALKLTLVLFSLLLMYLMLLFTQGDILNWLGIKDQMVKAIILSGKWLLILALIFYSFAFIYKYAPATQKRWRLLSPGAIMATFLSILTTIGFSAFLNNFDRYNVLYGSIGTIIASGTLIFLNSLVILLGFELNVSINSLRAMAQQRELEEAQNPNSTAI